MDLSWYGIAVRLPSGNVILIGPVSDRGADEAESQALESGAEVIARGHLMGKMSAHHVYTSTREREARQELERQARA